MTPAATGPAPPRDASDPEPVAWLAAHTFISRCPTQKKTTKAIRDAHYLGRDIQLAEQAMA
jgi:hypothetical protein